MIRTSVPAPQLEAAAAAAAYKSLARVERAFRSIKPALDSDRGTVDLHVRPVFHYARRNCALVSCTLASIASH